jgi:hypothetical protein
LRKEPVIRSSGRRDCGQRRNWSGRPTHWKKGRRSGASRKSRWGSITEAQTLDHVGITDVICLMGFYTSVSMTLAFYNVPAGAGGLAR